MCPHQFAVVVPAGCETVHKGVEALAELEDDVVASALDVKNAFNFIQKLPCLPAVRRLRLDCRGVMLVDAPPLAPPVFPLSTSISR